jgi:hypothetical protein
MTKDKERENCHFIDMDIRLTTLYFLSFQWTTFISRKRRNSFTFFDPRFSFSLFPGFPTEKFDFLSDRLVSHAQTDRTILIKDNNW